MATEPFVPEHRDSVYVDDELPPAKAWFASRPGEIAGNPDAETYGFVGPDAGYAATLVRLFRGRLVTGAANRDDVIAAAEAIAMRRAARYGRAPIAEDLEVAFLLLGALDDVPGDWKAAGADVAERVSGLRYPVAAARAGVLATEVAADWIEPKPAEVRARLEAEGPAGIFGEEHVA